MAIVKMKRITLIAENKNKKQILDELMWLSSVDITPLSDMLKDEKWSLLLKRDINDENGEKYRKAKDDIDKSIEILNPYSVEKRSIFTKPHELSRNDFNEFDKNNKDVLYLAYSVLDIKNKLNMLKTDENKQRTLLQSLSVWNDFPLDLNTPISKHVDVELGVMPSTEEIDKDLARLYEKAPECYAEILGQDNEQYYVALIYLRSTEVEIKAALAPFHWAAVSFKDLYGTVDENIMLINERLAQIEEQRNALTTQLIEYAKELPTLEKASDIVTNNAQLYSVRDNLLCTKNTFMLDGWCPSKCVPQLQKKLEAFDCYYEVNDPAEDEEPPVLLKNNGFTTPFETITKMYALPTYRGLDPDFIMAPFFFVFFGMMLGDAGYGIILTLLCALALKFGHFKKSMRQNLKLFLLCGISTIIWGLLFGSFFGNVINLFSETFLGQVFELRALWFNPMDAPLTLLVLSFGIGFVHVIIGMFMKLYMLIRDKRFVEAFCDVGLWLLTLISVVVFALGSILPVPEIIGKIGLYATLAGVFGLILTQGRDKKNPIAKLFSGILSLYDITGYLSDILSYSRILALGLSSSVIAMVFNYLAVLFGGGLLGAVVFVIIFTLGTVLNLALSTLSAYVHSSRLQFIEFFSKFYESGGREFNALRVETNYSDIN
ncbi:MAG: hypothetical protein DBX47_05060 [Clostridiales bacterium]|nr:MAG: hypothetical protein DBX47_05060 [Clostridiales bacterium]